MSLFHEEWAQESYYMRSHLHLRDLPENHLKAASNVPFKFEEYRVPQPSRRPTTTCPACPTSAPTSSASTTTG